MRLFNGGKGGSAWALPVPAWAGTTPRCSEESFIITAGFVPQGLWWRFVLKDKAIFSQKKKRDTHWALEWKQMLKDNKAFYYESII